MTVICSGPDTSLGVAYRLSDYLDCQARALGENGFQALAGGAMGTAILSAMVTVFIALIGYRLLLGHVPDARDGIGWAVRLGIVLALVTSWPAFQSLVYRVAVDAPPDIAAVLLPASGLAGESLAERVQISYDTLRLGISNAPAAAAAQAGQPAAATVTPPLLLPLKKTASLLVISTMGLAGALRIAIGFLLAVAPLAIMSLLFRGTNGLFIGWARALAGAALGLVGATVVTAIHLVAVESELAHLAAVGGGEASATVDPQALTTVVMFFALVAAVTTLAAIRMGSALRLPPPHFARPSSPAVLGREAAQPVAAAPNMVSNTSVRGVAGPAANGRAAAVAETLTTAVHREQRPGQGAGRANAPPPGQAAGTSPATQRGEDRIVERIGVTGRRSIGRRTLSATRRDRVA